jgi:hypothetical protein
VCVVCVVVEGGCLCVWCVWCGGGHLRQPLYQDIMLKLLDRIGGGKRKAQK